MLIKQESGNWNNRKLPMGNRKHDGHIAMKQPAYAQEIQLSSSACRLADDAKYPGFQSFSHFILTFPYLAHILLNIEIVECEVMVW
jgi:hypothetical protein